MAVTQSIAQYYADLETIMRSDKSSLDDLDKLYRRIQAETNKDARFNSIKIDIITSMYKNYNLRLCPEKENIAFYTQEIISISNSPNIEMISDMLNSLIGYWDNQKIARSAEEILAKISKFHKSNSDNSLESLEAQYIEIMNLMYLAALE